MKTGPVRRSLWLAALGCGFTGLALALFALRPSEGVRGALPAAADLAEAAPELVALAPGSTEGRREAARDAVAAQSRSVPVSSAAAPSRTVLLRGIIRAAVPDLESTVVGVLADESSARFLRLPNLATVRPDAAGRFEVDLTPVLAHRSSPGDAAHLELRVDAEHRLCEPAVVVVTVPLDPGTVPQDGAEPLLLEVELALERATCIVGTIRMPGEVETSSAALSAFVRGPAGELSAFDSRTLYSRAARAGALERRGRGAGRAEANGTYVLRVAPGTSYAIVAAAPGLQPQTQWVDVPVPGDYRLDFALDSGALLCGTLRLDGSPAPAGTVVTAALVCGAAQHLKLGSGQGSLCSIGGELGWSHALAKTSAGGRFELAGLMPGIYTLRAVGLGIPGQHLRSVPVAEVRAPCEGLEIGPVLARAALDFGAPQAQPTAFALRPQDAGGRRHDLGPFETDASGLALVSLPPGAAYEVLVEDSIVGRIATGEVGSSVTWRIAR